MTRTKGKYHVLTFGCQMNHSDSERLASALENYGFCNTETLEDAELVIFNTCSIKQKAEDKVLGHMKKITKMKAVNPKVKLGITGCMTRITSSSKSRTKDELFKQIPDLDICFPIKDLPKIGSLLKDVDPDFADLEQEEADLGNYFKIAPKYKTPFQAYLPIMTGCDKFCTYCIVPYSRGRETSRPIQEVYEEAVKIVKNGGLEITLLGQNVNSYGLSWADKKSDKFTYNTPPFVQLLKKLDTIDGLKRLRFTSPHPQDMCNQVVDAIADLDSLMPYIHLPLQSGSDHILKKMNRNYDTKKFMEIVHYIRKRMPNCAISTDIIVGFCGETEEHFQDTYNLFKEACFDLAFISQYSTRKGTVAGLLKKDDVPAEVKKLRWHKLNDLLRETSLIKNKHFEGQIVNVLFERKSRQKGTLKGRTEHAKEVILEGSESLIGQIVPVKILESQEWRLIGELVS